MVLYYRKDLFDRAGLKAEALKTRFDYVDAGKKHPLRPDVNSIVNRAVTAALRGELAPRDALKSAGDEARSKLKQEGF